MNQYCPMNSYALTNLQLFNQLRDLGYTQEDLGRMHCTYELARLLFSGQIKASGRTQLSHCVRTASILAFYHGPVHLVGAGLIHNVYSRGDFGDGLKGPLAQRRKFFRERLGSDLEQVIRDFVSLKWNEETLSDFMVGKGSLTYDVVFLQLAEILEQHLDGDSLYDQKFTKGVFHTKMITPLLIQSAESIGLFSLAQELARVKRKNDLPQPYGHLHKRYGNDGGIKVIPPSYRQKYHVDLLRIFGKLVPRTRRLWSMVFKKKLTHYGLC